jgi:hypothetical protein
LTRPLLTVAEAPVVIPVWLNTVVPKLGDVDTMTLYIDAPAVAFQLRVGVNDWLTAPFVGNASEGIAGSVVKLQTLDQLALGSPVSTLQK